MIEPGADPTHLKMDLTSIRRELFREMAPNGTFETMTPDERQRVGREVNQRLLGIVQGLQLSAAEVQKKAEAAKLAAVERAAPAAAAEAKAATSVPVAASGARFSHDGRAAPAASAGRRHRCARATGCDRSACPEPGRGAYADAGARATARSKPMTRKTALTGNQLNVRMERDGEVVQQVNAEINLPNLLATVFANTRRDSGEIPFAVGKDGHLYAPNERRSRQARDARRRAASTTCPAPSASATGSSSPCRTARAPGCASASRGRSATC